MPPSPHGPDTRPAEQVLEDLLRTWPPPNEPRRKAMPNGRPFATAFLPPASHQMPRLPAVRLTASPMARVDLRWMREPDDTVLKPGASSVPMPTFRAVADAIAARGAHYAARVRAADADADDAAKPAQGTSDSSEEHRFAAQIVALKAAGVLDPPAASGGGSPGPYGYADNYVEDAVPASVRHAENTWADPPIWLAEPSRAQRPASNPPSPVGSDDDIALPRSIFL